MAVLPVGIGSAEEGGYQIERSLRFNSADSAYLNRTPASAGNRKTWTWSAWVKRSDVGTSDNVIFQAGSGTPWFICGFGANVTNSFFVSFNAGSSGVNFYTAALFRDPSAWYHIVLAVDTTQATDTNRVKIYVNGIQATTTQNNAVSLNYDTQVNNTQAHYIGRNQASNSYFSGYLTEINFIDGSALDPTSFGEFNSDTGVWQPKAYTGSYGTNGFYLDFADNSGTTSTTLGADSSGNGNNWTPNNFSVTAGAGNDSLVDSPTRYGTDTGAGGEVRGNYATLNPLDSTLTLVNGNLNSTAPVNTELGARGTIGVSSGKWYYEYQVTLGNQFVLIGWASQTQNNNSVMPSGVGATGWAYYPFDLKTYSNGTASAVYGTAGSANDIIMVALDLDNSKIYWGRNGTWFNSGNPATGTNAAYTNVSGTLFPWIQEYSQPSIVNFGQRPFAYTAPSGFKALVTTNLPEPTIADGGEYFNTVLYTGNGSTQSVTGVGFQPDWIWWKSRSAATSHATVNAVTGAKGALSSNNTSAEYTESTNNGLISFDSDGFTVGNDGNYTAYNQSGSSIVAWNWKANGAGVSNTDGTITSTVSVNTTSGFSIVTYTGTGANATVGHGLGVAPSMILGMNRTSVRNKPVFHASIGAANIVWINLTNAQGTNSAYWQSTLPTSSVFSVGNNGDVNESSSNHVAYCFAPVAGYSAFGSYTGNGSADGPMVYTGFRPAFVMIKRTDATNDWIMCDAERNPTNAVNLGLYADLSNAENTSTRYDFLSNGFKMRSTLNESNASGGTYIYMAFSEVAFNYSLGR
jgi:hypothetical protein